MSEPHTSLLGRFGALALEKMPTRFGSLFPHSRGSRPLSACERLPGEVLEEIFRLRFQDEIANLRVRVKIFSKLALVCKAWASAAGAAAFEKLQLDGTDPVAVAYFDAEHGPGYIHLSNTQSVILAEVHDMQGAFVRFAEIFSQMEQQRQNPNAGAPTVSSSSFGSPLSGEDRGAPAEDDFAIRPRRSELEVVRLQINPENEQTGKRLPAIESIEPVQNLKEIVCQTWHDPPVPYDLVAPLIPSKANLTEFRWIGHLPRDLCRKLVLRVESVGLLLFGYLDPEGDLAQSLIPRLPTLRSILIQKLQIDVKPNHPLLNQAPQRMPYATNLLDRLPTNIQTVDATCELMNMATAFARNARLAAILARPASHALELDDTGHLVPVLGVKQPLQIVYLNADGHPPKRYAFVRFGSVWDYTEWSHVDIPSTGQQWKM
ncbi:hypothetical protein BMF94_3963 [Rhodotorula taiwanensis]|uniref:F-box domain-containing protein n=1 Tax=Rhodotorula taiwanensis TaxID=741276 RepID=A0A2S5B891_9BASI|nr:hypothetical protein BMF94_3963 [Rhodotorula taiwanensis]